MLDGSNMHEVSEFDAERCSCEEERKRERKKDRGWGRKASRSFM
jgi:hypothetical protein